MNPLKSSKWRRTAAAASAMAVLTTLTACGGSASPQSSGAAATISSDQLAANAKSEGTLVTYTAFPDAIEQALDKAFTAKYGVTVKSQRLIADAFNQRVNSELQAAQHNADVIIGSDEAAFQTWKSKGLLAQLPVSGMPSAAKWPSNYKSDSTVSVQTNIYGILYNTALLPPDKAPKTWDDLLDPSLKKKILLLDPKNGTASQYQYNLLLQQKGQDYLQKLGAQASFINSGVPGSQNVGAGAAEIYAPAVPPVVALAKQAGQKVAAVYPTPLAASNIVAAEVTGATHSNAAALYVDFLMSSDGQAIINKDGYSALSGVPGTQPLPADLTPANNDQTVANADKIIKLLAG
jgi:iron(III) transport system substrate-binding protein